MYIYHTAKNIVQKPCMQENLTFILFQNLYFIFDYKILKKRSLCQSYTTVYFFFQHAMVNFNIKLQNHK